ncbi:unnamed protein product, partial [Didymodactylos carnosus]
NVSSQLILPKFFDLEQHQHLTYLRLCIDDNDSTDDCYNLLCQKVFSIPTLKICYLLTYDNVPKLLLTSPAIKLEYLQIHLGYKSDLLMLLNYIPSIKHLSVSITEDITTTTDDSTAIVQLPYKSDVVPYLTKLYLSTSSIPFEWIESLLKCLTPHLEEFRFESGRCPVEYLDGCQWSNLIEYYMPKINKFELNLSMICAVNNIRPYDINDLRSYYRTEYFIKQNWHFSIEYDYQYDTWSKKTDHILKISSLNISSVSELNTSFYSRQRKLNATTISPLLLQNTHIRSLKISLYDYPEIGSLTAQVLA